MDFSLETKYGIRESLSSMVDTCQNTADSKLKYVKEQLLDMANSDFCGDVEDKLRKLVEYIDS